MIFNNITSTTNIKTFGVNKDVCEYAIKRYSCLTVFPECNTISDTQGNERMNRDFVPMCREQCKMVSVSCRPIDAILDCSIYPTTNCFYQVPEGYYYIDIDDGYDSLYYFCIILTVFWFCITAYSNFQSYYVFPKCPSICRYVSLLGIVKVGVLVTVTVFWGKCVEDSLCSYEFSTLVSAFQMIYITALFALLLVLSTGFSITTTSLEFYTWKLFFTMICVLYVAINFLSALRNQVSGIGYYISVIIIYCCTYGLTLYLSVRELKLSYSQVKYFHTRPANLANDVTEPILDRHNAVTSVFCSVLLLYFADVSAELLVWRSTNYVTVIYLYEVFSSIALVSLFYYFRAREFSPFYFAAPSTFHSQDSSGRILRNRNNLPSIVELTDGNSNDEDGICHQDLENEIELAPLIGSERLNSVEARSDSRDKRMIIVSSGSDILVGTARK